MKNGRQNCRFASVRVQTASRFDFSDFVEFGGNILKGKKSLIKRILNRIFIDGLSGMALGLFATLIVGTILQQLSVLITDYVSAQIGEYILLVSKAAMAVTGAGIGVGVARKFGESPLVVVAAAVNGMVGAFAAKIIAGQILSESGAVVLQGPGEPLGAFIAAYVGIEVGRLISGKTKLDILLTPICSLAAGSAIGLLAGPPISGLMTKLGEIIGWATVQHPFVMGIVVSVIMGMALTLPISSAALGIILNLNGLAAGAAVAGCCANMVGFAAASYRENKLGGAIAQGLGTSMIQIPNIVKKPIIWLPAIISSAILGPVSTMIVHMECNATGAGMGSAGLVGQIMTYRCMAPEYGALSAILIIAVMQFLLPAVLSLAVSEFLRKKNLIKLGDMRLETH